MSSFELCASVLRPPFWTLPAAVILGSSQEGSLTDKTRLSDGYEKFHVTCCPFLSVWDGLPPHSARPADPRTRALSSVFSADCPLSCENSTTPAGESLNDPRLAYSALLGITPCWGSEFRGGIKDSLAAPSERGGPQVKINHLKDEIWF